MTEPRPVPLCAVCGHLVLIARRVEGGTGVEWESPSPTQCTARPPHRLLPGLTKVAARMCPCPAPGQAHSVWTCLQCQPWSEQEAPTCVWPREQRDRQKYPGGRPTPVNAENRPAPDPKA